MVKTRASLSSLTIINQCAPQNMGRNGENVFHPHLGSSPSNRRSDKLLNTTNYHLPGGLYHLYKAD